MLKKYFYLKDVIFIIPYSFEVTEIMCNGETGFLDQENVYLNDY